MSKLGIAQEMRAVDTKDRDFYDNLSDEERKQFSTYLMIRWASSVASGNPEIDQYYLLATNERLNKNFFNLTKAFDPSVETENEKSGDVDSKYHDKLNWLATTTISPGIGTQRHEWISAPKRKAASTKAEKFLGKMYPELKADDITLMASLNDTKSLKKLAEAMGMSPEQIKKEL